MACKSVCYILCITLSLLAVGCGFHLRGIEDLPVWLNQTAIVVENENHEWERRFDERLEAYNITPEHDPRRATRLLVIERDEVKEEISAISSSTSSRQYQLIYQVQFKVISNKGAIIIPSQQISLSRQITINNDRILGSTQEKSLMQDEMRKDIMTQILFRLGKY